MVAAQTSTYDLLNAVDAAILLYQVDSTILYANDAACRLTGYTREQIMLYSTSRLFDPNLPVKRDQGVYRVRGQHRSFNVYGTATTIEYNDAPALMLTFHPEAPHMLARTIIERFPNGGIGMFDRDCRFTLVGGLGWQEIGMSPEDLRDKTPDQIFQPPINDIIVELMERTLAGEYLEREIPFKGHMYRLHLLPVYDDRNQVTGGLAMTQDITELEESRTAMMHYARRFQAALEGNLDAVYILDAVHEDDELVDFAFVQVNNNGAKMMGMPREKMIGQRLCELFPINRTSGFFDKYRRVYKTGETLEEEFEIPADNPGEGWFRHQVVALNTGIAIFTRNVSDRKAAEIARQQKAKLEISLQKESELNTLRQRMLRTLSHELRTPLAVMLTASSMLEDYFERMQPEKRKDYLQKIRQQIIHLSDMLHDMAWINENTPEDSNTMSADLQTFTTFDLPDLIANVIDEFERPVITHFPPECQVFASQDMLQRSLYNILANAFTYSAPDSPVHLTISIDSPAVEISIADQGMGIPDAEQSRIFDMFYRGSNAEATEGIGLGLVIVQQCAQVHKGSIELESNASGGTTFHLKLPIHFPDRTGA